MKLINRLDRTNGYSSELASEVVIHTMSGARPNEKYLSTSRTRGKSDLIDLSCEIGNKLGSNILDLFDPLNQQEPTAANGTSVTRQAPIILTRPTNKSASLQQPRRRTRTSSVCTLSISSEKYEITTNNKQDKQPSKNSSHSSLQDTSGSRTDDNQLSRSTQEEEDSINDDARNNSETSAISVNSSDTSNPAVEDAYKAHKHKQQQHHHHLLTQKRSSTFGNIKYRLKLERKQQRSSQELSLLTKKIKALRATFKHQDAKTNTGIVYSPKLFNSKFRDMSVKVVITSTLACEPLRFTCSVSTNIEHLISHAVCSMFENFSDENMDNYMLKISGKDEYFDSSLSLADYEYVSNCWKFDLDTELTLVRAESVKRALARTSKDDFSCKSLLSPDDLLSRPMILKYSDLNYEALSITIDTFEREVERLQEALVTRSRSLQTQALLQCTKAICSLMLCCESSQLTESKNNLEEICLSYTREGSSLQEEDHYKMIEVIQHAIDRLIVNIHWLFKLTSSSLPVDYEILDLIHLGKGREAFVPTSIATIKDNVSLQIMTVAQLKPEWLTKYQDFHIQITLMHGQSVVCPSISTSTVRVNKSFFFRLLFDEDLTLSIPYMNLPRETRLVFNLYGTVMPMVTSSNQLTIPADGSVNPMRRSVSATSICSTAPMYSSSPQGSQIVPNPLNNSEPVQNLLASGIMYMFDSSMHLVQGDKLLYLHTVEQNIAEDIYIDSLGERQDLVVVVKFKKFSPEKKIFFPPITEMRNAELKVDSKQYDSLDPGVKFVMDSILEQKQLHEQLMDDEKTLLWNNRLYCTSLPSALPKVLLSVPSWSPNNLTHIYSLLDAWSSPGAVDAIQLLLPAFPDEYVRSKAIEWISAQDDDELYDYLPQLLQAFRFEKSMDCSLFWLIFSRALGNIRIANLIYWQLKTQSCDKIFKERCETLTSSLLWMSGAAFWKSIEKQEGLLGMLSTISNEIKKTRDNQRAKILKKMLEKVQDYLIEKKPVMPWCPSLEVCDLELNSCNYFASNTTPLKLSFRSCEESCNRSVIFYKFDTIFKVGDDLRQDMLAMQMIKIMEKLWLREGLDLRMVTFDCLATNHRQGMVEMVRNADTLCKIQQKSSFITGSFNQRAIDNHIRHWNTSELEYKSALDTFLHSCAGYSVATYILGICDRHNDNIMVTNSGHLFHIDFGKFLGDAQMVGSIKRDRTPFVLTADMAYVINGGDRPSKRFQTFVELCTMSFNIIRRHRNLFLNLFSLMSSAKIHGLNVESLKYIDRMLMPNLTETEAMSKFTRIIEECLKSRSTQFNFFIHNLAQLRFSNDMSKQSLLSFIPKTFSIQTEGQITSLEIINLYKTYEPEKQYYYVVRVGRANSPDYTNVSRSFREFSELEMKLSCTYSGHNFLEIQKSTTSSFLMDFVGRTNTLEIAEKRLIKLKAFLRRLLELPPEISHCDLIYTFFHPILRDQSYNSGDPHSIAPAETSSTFDSQREYNDIQRSALYLGANGQVKLSVSYKNSSLIIMIMHAKNLACPNDMVGPNCYAKTYLLPDPLKQTKRKTRTIKQSRHPSFMELIVYKIPQESFQRLTLQVSIWHSEIVQYKYFMGAALIPLNKIDLSKETIAWYPLKDF